MNEILIKIEGISHEYQNGNKVLNNITFDIENNGITSLFGPSGSGKSTLLFIIGKILTPKNGNINYNFDNIKKRMGFIFQNFNMLNELTVFQNCKVAQNIRNFDSDDEIYSFAEKIDITKFLNKYPNELSSGQLQRAAILRAIVGNTRIILCDEPTGALDSENKRNIMEIFKLLCEDRTFFIVSHDEVVKHYSTRVLQLEDGRLL